MNYKEKRKPLSEARLASVIKIEATRDEILDLFTANDIKANEALSLVSALLVQLYCGLVENESRKDFIEILTQCYDAYQLLHGSDEGSVQ